MAEQITGQSEVEQVARLALVARALTSALEPSEILDIVVRQGMAGLDAEGGVIALLDARGFIVPAVAVGYPPAAVSAFGPLTLERELPLTVAVRELEPVWVASRADALERFPTLVANSATTSQAWAAIPLRLDGLAIGVLGVSFLREREFAEAERLFIGTLGDLCAVALAGGAGPDAGRGNHLRDGLAKTDWRGLGLGAYVSIFEHSLDGVMFTAPDGRVLAANPAARALLGMEEGEILDAGRDGLADPSDDRWEVAVEERRRSGRARAELRMRRADGTVFLADIASVVFDTNAGPRTCTIVRDVTERTELLERQASLIEELGRLAIVDELTGLQNRRGFGVAAEAVLAVADRRQAPTQVLFIDVDDMKRINDQYGHERGDRALADVATALRQSLRSGDIAARIGGDEFVALVHDATVEQAEQVAVRFTEALSALRTLDTRAITASIGIASRQPGERDLTHLLSAADRRMYTRKRAAAMSEPRWSDDGRVVQAAALIVEQRGCTLAEAINLLRERTYALGQSLEHTALDVLDGEVRFDLLDPGTRS